MKKKILIVASNYYKKITSSLISNGLKTLKKENSLIKIIKVSGTFEIPVIISKNIKKYDGFVVLGCVIKGETPHFDFICSSVFNGLINISINSKKPIGNGIITCLNMSQALKRSKNKGSEAAIAILDILKNGQFK
tara:strand:- start:76 stop:480 length:405 start_codon:yes stop_codon:yes gene_type:complete